MKLFETALENLAFMGIEWDESALKCFSTKRYLITIALCFTCIISTFLFLVYDAKSLVEYTEGLFIFSTAISCCIISLSAYIKMHVLSDFIKNCKDLINQRK